VFQLVIFMTVRFKCFPVIHEVSGGARPRMRFVLLNDTANENCKTHGLNLIGPFCNDVVPRYVNIPTYCCAPSVQQEKL
jgi:hypothetical protein